MIEFGNYEFIFGKRVVNLLVVVKKYKINQLQIKGEIFLYLIFLVGAMRGLICLGVKVEG